MNRVKSEGKLNAGASLSAEPLDASQGTLHAATTAAACNCGHQPMNIDDQQEMHGHLEEKTKSLIWIFLALICLCFVILACTALWVKDSKMCQIGL